MAKVYCSVLFSFAVYRNMYTDRRANNKQSVPVNGSPNLIARHCNQCLNCGRKNAQNKSVDSNREGCVGKGWIERFIASMRPKTMCFLSLLTTFSLFLFPTPIFIVIQYMIHKSSGKKNVYFFSKSQIHFPIFQQQPVDMQRYAKSKKNANSMHFNRWEPRQV